MNDTTKKTMIPNEGYRPQFAIYHPNGKGTGCALKMELHPAHGDVDGCIMMCLAQQKTVGDMRGPTRTFPTFDWENRICVKLDFADLCKFLQVFRGECESIEDGKGLYHRSMRYTTRIVFRHLIDPVQGYSLEVYRDTVGRPDESRMAHIVLNSWESLGVGISFENSIGLICFGIPKTVVSERAEEAEERNAYDIPA